MSILAGLGSLASSALGSLPVVGGPAASIGGGFLNAAYQAHLNRRSTDHQFSLSQQMLRQSPSIMRQGLLDAGYNPLLAVSNGIEQGASPQAFGVNVSDSGLGTSALQSRNLKKEGDILSSECDIARSQAASAKAESEADIARFKLQKEMDDERLAAFDGVGTRVDVKVGRDDGESYGDNGEVRENFRRSIMNSIENDRYSNSREHRIYEDILSGVDSASSALGAVLNGKASLMKGRAAGRMADIKSAEQRDRSLKWRYKNMQEKRKSKSNKNSKKK